MDLYDTFTIDSVRRTSDGYLAAFARVARTGIQEYRGSELGRPELDKVRVYRPPSEVFAPDALRSFAHRPVTLKHPTTPVTSRNWKQHAGGQTGDEVVRDGEFVRVPMVMMDQGLIDAYEKNGIKELSMGYSTDIKWRSGVTDAGETYDAVQTDIRGNHLAVVPLARGGDQLRIGDEDIDDDKDAGGHGSYPRGEGGGRDEVQSLRDQMKTALELYGADSAKYRTLKAKLNKLGDTQTLDGETHMTKLIIDGVPVTVADDQSGAIIERHIKTLTDANKTLTDSFDDFKKKKKEDDKECMDAKALVQTRDGEIVVLKKQIEDAKVTPEVLDALVKTRSAVIDKAKKLVGDKYVFDGKTVEMIRKDAVISYVGDSAKDMSDGAVEGAFLALTVKDAAKSDKQIADAISHRPHSASTTVDARDAAFNQMETDLQNAWKTPAPAH